MSQLNNVTVICFTNGSGVSKKSGAPKPYSFAQIEYLVQAEPFRNDDHDIRKYGFDVKQLNVGDDSKTEARMSQVPFGQKVNLLMEADPKRPDRNIVVNWEVAEK